MASAHTAEQPGLQTTSWDPENDLMKQFVIEINRPGQHGWLAMASSTKFWQAELRSVEFHCDGTLVRIFDQFNNVVKLGPKL